jgi:hypothetical protein
MHSYSQWKMEVSGNLYAPNTLALGKQLPVPTEQQGGWAPEPVLTLWRKVFSPESNPDSSVVQPVAHRYGGWVIPSPY